MAHEPMTDVPREDPLVIVEAFLDGERVDAGALERALSDAAARAHFVDLLKLRDVVAMMTPVDAAGASGQSGRFRGVRWIAAAAAVVLSLGAGYFAGQNAHVAEAAAPAVESVVNLDAPPAARAPAPTRIIRLEPGVNWTERVEGR